MINWISQVVTVTGMNIRSLPQRWGSTTVAVIGIAGVVMVMVSCFCYPVVSYSIFII